MTEAAINLTEPETLPERCIRFRSRFLIYFAVWLLAVFAFEVFLQPEGLTETHLTPLQQRLQWPLLTPLMVSFGLAQVLSTPGDMPQSFFWFCVAVFVVHAVLTLSRTRPSVFMSLIAVQALALGIGVACFIHSARLPHGA